MKVEITKNKIIGSALALLAALNGGGLYNLYDLFMEYELLKLDRDVLLCEVAALKRNESNPDCWQIPIKRFREGR